jgi:uncharacterized protein YbjT (DUF2867 family)
MIVITTPTGRIGRRIVDSLIEGPEKMRVIARDPARLPARVRERAEIVQGSHRDPAVTTEAFAGADTVFWLTPPEPTADTPEEHYLGFARAACAAIRRQGVARVVAVSSLGHGYGRNAGLLSPTFAVDELIASTGVAYRPLRPPFFLENLLGQAGAIADQGTLTLANDGDRVLLTCAVRDVAAAAAGLLRDGGWRGQEAVPVVGPDDLTPREMAATLSDALTRPVRFELLGRDDYRAALARYGLPEAWTRGMADMAAAQDDGVYRLDPGAPRAATGFRRWCEEVLRPAVSGSGGAAER